MRCGELLHATGGGMQAQLEFIKGERSFHWDHELTIEHETLRVQLGERRDDIREIARERLPSFGLQVDCRFTAGAKSDTAEAIPLWLILPIITGGDFRHRAS